MQGSSQSGIALTSPSGSTSSKHYLVCMNMKPADYAKQIEASLADALDRCTIDPKYQYDVIENMRWWAFPQTWSSTSGMKGGPGGQAIITEQTVAVLLEDYCYVYSGGRFMYTVERSECMMGYIKAQDFPSKPAYEQALGKE